MIDKKLSTLLVCAVIVLILWELVKSVNKKRAVTGVITEEDIPETFRTGMYGFNGVGHELAMVGKEGLVTEEDMPPFIPGRLPSDDMKYTGGIAPVPPYQRTNEYPHLPPFPEWPDYDPEQRNLPLYINKIEGMGSVSPQKKNSVDVQKSAQGTTYKKIEPELQRLGSNFYLENNRALGTRLNGSDGCSVCSGTLNAQPMICGPSGPNQKFGKSSQWAVKYTPGANNTCSDCMWHKISPKMILKDNCMRCHEFGPDATLNPPSGVSSGLTEQYEETMENGRVRDMKLLYDDLLPCEELHTGNKMSSKMSSGIVPQHRGCVEKRIYDTKSKCGCDGFGSRIYNFHK